MHKRPTVVQVVAIALYGTLDERHCHGQWRGFPVLSRCRRRNEADLFRPQARLDGRQALRDEERLALPLIQFPRGWRVSGFFCCNASTSVGEDIAQEVLQIHLSA